MKLSLTLSEDGSHTLCREDLNETYHSIHGAIQESNHVFINAGLKHWLQINGSKEIEILEVGFGTGLNALLTLDYLQNATKMKCVTKYTGYELFPLAQKIIQQLNYTSQKESLNILKKEFKMMHAADWSEPIKLNPKFELTKLNKTILKLDDIQRYDLIFYDAFAPQVEPTLWDINVFTKIYNATKPGGIFVTYCAKGQVRRDLESVGFEMERIAGPPGKREMLRGTKY